MVSPARSILRRAASLRAAPPPGPLSRAKHEMAVSYEATGSFKDSVESSIGSAIRKTRSTSIRDDYLINSCAAGGNRSVPRQHYVFPKPGGQPATAAAEPPAD